MSDGIPSLVQLSKLMLPNPLMPHQVKILEGFDELMSRNQPVVIRYGNRHGIAMITKLTREHAVLKQMSPQERQERILAYGSEPKPTETTCESE